MGRPRKEKPNRAGGLYEIKITIGRTLDGKYIRKSFYSPISKEDARQQAEEWKIAKAVAEQTGGAFVERETRFAKWAAQWLVIYKKPKVSANTYRLTYQNTVEKHLVPYFGDALLTDIRPADIERFYGTKSGVSQSMLDKMSLCLNGIFESALENDLCRKNPARNIHPVSREAKRLKHVLTNQQIAALEEYAEQNGRLDVVLLLETGMRRGELLGLRREDIDWKNQSYTVARSVADRHGGGVELRPPKWGSTRTNPLSEKAYEILRRAARETGSVFPSPNGGAQSPNTWSQGLARFMDRTHREHPDIPVVTAHELRHTYGTALRRRGVDIYTIQKVMGHRDITVTTEIYVHNELEALRRAIKGENNRSKKRYKCRSSVVVTKFSGTAKAPTSRQMP